MVKSIIRVIYNGSKVLAKSLLKSVHEEIEISRQLARNRYQDQKAGGSETNSGEPSLLLSLDEAKRILNVNNLDPEEVEKQFKYLFEANSKSSGGSFYLQSKVFRAKQRIDFEMKRNSDNNEEDKKQIV